MVNLTYCSFSDEVFFKDVLIELALDIPATAGHLKCGYIAGEVREIQTVGCLTPSSSRYVIISTNHTRIDIYEIEVKGH